MFHRNIQFLQHMHSRQFKLGDKHDFRLVFYHQQYSMHRDIEVLSKIIYNICTYCSQKRL